MSPMEFAEIDLKAAKVPLEKEGLNIVYHCSRFI
jgi:hypothetical protein